jgi:hypothetical protein
MLRRLYLLSKLVILHSYNTRIIKMSTFILPETDIPVKLADDLTKEQLLEFPAFKVPSP